MGAIEFWTNSPEETKKLATIIAGYIKFGQVILLEGLLGSGKTTFAQGLGRALGIDRAIKSPTYTIARNYPIKSGEFIHMDAYRLEETDSSTIDLDLFLRPDAITLIEWAQFIEDDLPESYWTINFDLQEDPTVRRIAVDIVDPYCITDREYILQSILSAWKGR